MAVIEIVIGSSFYMNINAFYCVEVSLMVRKECTCSFRCCVILEE